MLRPQSALFYLDSLQDISADLVSAVRRSLDPATGETRNDGGTLALLHLWAFEAISCIFLNVRFGCLEEGCDPEIRELIDQGSGAERERGTDGSLRE